MSRELPLMSRIESTGPRDERLFKDILQEAGLGKCG